MSHVWKDSSGLTGCSDSNYGDDLDARKSSLGFVITLGIDGELAIIALRCNCIINNRSGVYSHCRVIQRSKVAEMCSWRNVQGVFGKCLFFDSQSATQFTKNQNTFHKRSKHIDIKFNFMWDEVELKMVNLVKINTKEYTIDMMVKLLLTNKFTLCVDFLV